MTTSTRPYTLIARTSACMFAATLAFASPASAHERDREGGRFGIALNGGFGIANDPNGNSATIALIGPTLRFGGAVTDRFHLLGEFHLLFLPGATLGSVSSTAFHAALDLAGQGYIGPRFFIRGGVGAGWASSVSSGHWSLPLPGPRVSGAVGYDVWRQGGRAFSVSLETSYTVLYASSQSNPVYRFDSLFTFGASVGFDWY